MQIAATGPRAVLEHAAIGRPITRAGVSLFPVYLSQALATPVVTSRPGAIEITEAEAETVPTLSVTSLIDELFLLVEGETLAGGLQQRALNVSVLVAPRKRLDIPVSCVEAGRWHGSRKFDGTAGQVSRRVRRAKSATVGENVRGQRGKGSDQQAVWNSVDFELDRMQVACSTSAFIAMERVLDAQPGDGPDDHVRLAQAAEELATRGPLPGQCGVVVAHGSRIVAAEVLATPELVAARWESMIRGYILDAPTDVTGRPSASKALRFLRRFATGDAAEAPGVGAGSEHHVRTSRLVGQILSLDTALIHASAFALAE